MKIMATAVVWSHFTLCTVTVAVAMAAAVMVTVMVVREEWSK